MQQLQKIGGIAALLEAAAFILGFVVYALLLQPARYGEAGIDGARHAAFLVEHSTIMYIWYLIIYILFGILLVVLTLSLDQRLKERAAMLTRFGTVFGLIWAGLVIASGMVANIGIASVVELYSYDRAEAASLWYAMDVVLNGLGGGNEIVGGIWTLLVSKAAMRAKRLPRWLNILGFVVGGAGLLTTIPVLEPLGAVFGLGLIVWFTGIGIVLIKR